MEDRMWEEEISGGNSREATSRSLNSSSNKPTASFRHSKALVSSDVLLLLTVRHLGEFVDGQLPVLRGEEEVRLRIRL